MPLAVGGGIRSVGDIEFLLTHGADKVILNTACALDESFLEKAVRFFGSQAITVGVDFKKVDNRYIHYILNGTEATNIDPIQWCKKVEELGAGEIIINCISNDGRQAGYNIDDTLYLIDDIKIPVVISGGAGEFEDFYKALKTNKIDAVCASSFYLFNRHTPADVKKYLRSKDVPVRYSYS
jgi:cyclase